MDEQDGKPLPGIPDSQLHLSDVDALVRETGKLPTAAVRQHPLFDRSGYGMGVVAAVVRNAALPM